MVAFILPPYKDMDEQRFHDVSGRIAVEAHEIERQLRAIRIDPQVGERHDPPVPFDHRRRKT